MNFIDHPKGNMTFGAPKGLEEKVGSIKVKRSYSVPLLATSFTSLWKPTSEELASLLKGGSVALTIYGSQHPIVTMETYENPID